jgi:hypothetical protein
MSTPRIQVKPEILNILVPEHIQMNENVRNHLLELIQEELGIVLELAMELFDDKYKMCVNELRYILSLRGINICF